MDRPSPLRTPGGTQQHELVDSDIIFWDGGFRFFTGTSGCGGVPNAAYIEDIAAHEFGHALGMGHSSYTDATMYPSYSYCSQAFRTLAPDDIAGVRSLYPGSTPANTAPSITIGRPGATTPAFPRGPRSRSAARPPTPRTAT